ncbi:MAG: hypothetical protein RIC85_06225 [Gammaproteobacteria bacterium]
MNAPELTFDSVDDLVAAHSKGRLAALRPDPPFTVVRVGPLVELMLQPPLASGELNVHSSWLDFTSQGQLRQALGTGAPTWLGAGDLQGCMRTVFDLLKPEPNSHRTRFLMAARRAAENAGFPRSVAQCLAAAVREMESNIHEHSQRSHTGVIAYRAGHSEFEFVVADGGVGVLATLREAPEYRNLSDHGTALYTALQQGASRYGRTAHRGAGFRDLFMGLAMLNADLRFRSGNHALTIRGSRPELKSAQLAQKPYYQGFLMSAVCRLPNGSFATP